MIVNTGQWEQGCNLYIATDLGPVRATRKKKKTFLIQFYVNLKKGIGKLACLKVDIGKILGKLPWMSKIPLKGKGMAAISKI